MLTTLRAQLSPAGRPVLSNNEVELKSESGVELYGAPTVLLKSSCTFVLTNFRLIVIKGQEAKHLELLSVQRTEDLASIFRSSKRFRIYLKNGENYELKFLEGPILNTFVNINTHIRFLC